MENMIIATAPVPKTSPMNESSVKICHKTTIEPNEPLTKLGIVVVAVALRFVPNCSEPIVTNIAQKPTENPRENIIA